MIKLYLENTNLNISVCTSRLWCTFLSCFTNTISYFLQKQIIKGATGDCVRGGCFVCWDPSTWQWINWIYWYHATNGFTNMQKMELLLVCLFCESANFLMNLPSQLSNQSPAGLPIIPGLLPGAPEGSGGQEDLENRLLYSLTYRKTSLRMSNNSVWQAGRRIWTRMT